MTIDEAIKYTEKVTKEKEEQAWETQSSEEYMTCKECVDKYRQLTKWLKELKQLREQTKWIPCNEKMPEEYEWTGTEKFGTTISNNVLVTFEVPYGRFVKIIRFQNGELSSTDKHKMDALYSEWKVVAWMPLPKKYKAEMENKK